jgi:pyruvate,orthophosphate dikinase
MSSPASLDTKFVFAFEKGSASQKDLLGGKGANLAEMTKLGIPVPFGFTVSTDACREFYAPEKKEDQKLWDSLKAEILEELTSLEEKSGKKFGGTENPLLVSVRSGAAVSMPGMMDTVLNLGLNFDTVEALEKKSGNSRFAWDSFRRFVQMYSNVVLEIPGHHFEEVLHKMKSDAGKKEDTELSAEELKMLTEMFIKIAENITGENFPLDPKEQLFKAVEAVFKSWNIERAIYYRNMNNLPHDMGTAVNVQMMVFGNLGETSGTGVCFTRDPSTGENIFYGEFLMNAQGEDVVAGIRTPHQIADLQEVMPHIHQELLELRKNLETHFKDMQDIEFTIEDEKLFVLQTRTGKRSAAASFKIAVDMVKEGVLTKDEALLRISDEDVETMLHPQLDEKEKAKKIPLCVGLPASPGGVSGEIVFTAEDAVDAKKHEKQVILVRYETSPEDIAGMHSAEGVLTACGGMTSHAAVVARGMGRSCVSGASELKIDELRGALQIDNLILKKGDSITIDGSTGEVFEGIIPKVAKSLGGDLATILDWAKERKRLEVRTNADTPKDTARAVEFGAEGIGLCRTEHMFFKPERVFQIRKMILTEDEAVRAKALEKVQAFQEEDFIEIFQELAGRPLCIRLLDPPLHEFLPTDEIEIHALAESFEMPAQEVRDRIEHLHEMNPMMGHRGCRLLITTKGLLEAQINAVLTAAQKVKGSQLEIMVPLISLNAEFMALKKRIMGIAQNYSVDFKLGTMMETPRGCLRAPVIGKEAEFFSFGTNDLTQMSFGFSRDDSGKFLPEYEQQELIGADPFQVFDEDGVGELVKTAINAVPANFKTSVCGEHGGNGPSIVSFEKLGIKTVSCSPFRVPVAIIAAARARILVEKNS